MMQDFITLTPVQVKGGLNGSVGGGGGGGGEHLEGGDDGIDAVHGLQQLRHPEFDLHDALWFQDPATGRRVCIHLDAIGVDLSIDDHPGTAPQLSTRREVDEGRLRVGPQLVHNQGARLHIHT